MSDKLKFDFVDSRGTVLDFPKRKPIVENTTIEICIEALRKLDLDDLEIFVYAFDAMCRQKKEEIDNAKENE